MTVLASFSGGLRLIIAAAFAIILLLAAYFGGYIIYLQVSGNLHPVIEGELYRSAQPSAQQIRTYHSVLGLRSIINLRGANDGSVWYDDEVAVTEELGIAHYDFRMSAHRELSNPRMQQLVSILKRAQRPLLIHCHGGADRSGIAAALYLWQILGVDLDKAEGQLSVYFGHIGIPILSRSYAMDRSLDAARLWFQK